MMFVRRGTFPHMNGPKLWLYHVTYMTKSLQDPSLRDCWVFNSGEWVTKSLTEYTWGPYLLEQSVN